MQFDEKRAFDALAIPLAKAIPCSLWDLIVHESTSVSTAMSFAMTKTGRTEEDENTPALLSALVASFARWGYGDDPRISVLKSKRKAGFTRHAKYAGKSQISPPALETSEVPYGETLSAELDRAIADRLGLNESTPVRWKFSVVSGVLNLRFLSATKLGKSATFPVASATKTDLDLARGVVAQWVLKNGIPERPEQRESLARAVAAKCSPTIVGGWLNLGLYMVSSWEYARRELVRETGNENAIPDIRPIDDDSILDCYRCVFDLGPFHLVRVAEVNHVCTTKPEAEPHIFKVTTKHVDEARKLGAPKVDPSLSPCGICGGEYKDHMSDRVMVVQLLRDATAPEADKHLGPLQLAFDADGIDGMIFVDTPEKFRIKPPEIGENED